jgi:hypothetical protein
MASYKVPQDVEADDKLIGPFSFRQFIYLIIVVGAGFVAWGLAQLFIGLVILPLPIILLFGALALPLRKDQPMEIYLAALISFYLKPHNRLWDPDGIDSFIQITTPKTAEVNLTKGLSQTDAQQRIGYLANLVDTGGWAIRGAVASNNSAINNDAYLEAQGAEDVLDTSNSIAQSINTMMDKRTAAIRQEAIDHMHQPATADQSPQGATTPEQARVPKNIYNFPEPSYNPYPNSMQQSVISPLSDQPQQQEVTVAQPVDLPSPKPVAPSKKPTSPDIIRLASNTDLSIQTIAHEAHRIQEKEDEKSTDEVVISLR